MIVRNEWQRLAPEARAELIERNVKAELSGRLWRAALGGEATKEERTASSAMRGPSVDIDALVQALSRPETDPTLFRAAAIEPPATSEQVAGSGLNLGANASLQGAIETAAERTGMPPAALAAIIDAEAAKGTDGRWNSLSRNPRSSAAGLGQFLSGTWTELAQQTGTWLNGTAARRGWLNAEGRVKAECRAELLALRYDPRASIEATADYARANVDRLRARSVHIGTGEQELARAAYLAHHLGPADAVRFLKNTIPEERASLLLAAQVGSSSAARRIASAGNDATSAHRHWLNNYVDRRVRADRFTV